MASAPKRQCPRSGCRNLQPCREHGYDRERGSASERGYDRTWARLRRAFLAEHPLCADCFPQLTPATEVHHLCKVSTHPELRLDWDNLRALCRECHRIRTERGE